MAIAVVALMFSALPGFSGTAAADTVRAKQVAGDYAIVNATLDYRDFDGWLNRIKADASPELARRFDAQAPELKKVFIPAKWVSTATLIDAGIRAGHDGIYQVEVLLDVKTITTMEPAGMRSAITYFITVDEHAGWKITDISGADDRQQM
ncbi:hypothetical protein F3087_37360 [Nocardia colli]|uniref:Uncharacterized protein n=1 Tax=Nocardia colli TaxID=2545717 RepID=A0A5N0E2T7_9NOCA|nr:hypothetical protein [Nocardia colli]KAA8883738.1 hypothetical protein F3087_37360 [Nocardia colli]